MVVGLQTDRLVTGTTVERSKNCFVPIGFGRASQSVGPGAQLIGWVCTADGVWRDTGATHTRGKSRGLRKQVRKKKERARRKDWILHGREKKQRWIHGIQLNRVNLPDTARAKIATLQKVALTVSGPVAKPANQNPHRSFFSFASEFSEAAQLWQDKHMASGGWSWMWY